MWAGIECARGIVLEYPCFKFGTIFHCWGKGDCCGWAGGCVQRGQPQGALDRSSVTVACTALLLVPLGKECGMICRSLRVV